MIRNLRVARVDLQLHNCLIFESRFAISAEFITQIRRSNFRARTSGVPLVSPDNFQDLKHDLLPYFQPYRNSKTSFGILQSNRLDTARRIWPICKTEFRKFLQFANFSQEMKHDLLPYFQPYRNSKTSFGILQSNRLDTAYQIRAFCES